MNATERAKVTALARLRIPNFGHSAQIIKNLRWRVENNPTAVLATREKYLLDLACWHYRNQLGGLVTFDLPTDKPQLADYQRTHPVMGLQDRLL